MKKLLVLGLALCTSFAFAQNRKLPIDTTITTQHAVTINGARIDYTATTGTQPVWDEMGPTTSNPFTPTIKKTKTTSKPIP